MSFARTRALRPSIIMNEHNKVLSPHHSIFVAGHRGMVGAAIVRKLKAVGYKNIITRTRAELDLTNQSAVADFFKSKKIDYVILAAARVGGIHANNTYPAEFIHQNLMIEANVIHSAWQAGVQGFLFLGSSCIYPKFAPQPMREEYLLSGVLEPTNEPYAIAKIAGIKMCEAYNRQYGTRFRAVMPTNLYGFNDNFDLENSHVIPALLRKFHLAKMAMAGNLEAIKKDEKIFGAIPVETKTQLGLSSNSSQVTIWGTGIARREFLHVDDLAAACLFVMGLSDTDYQKGLTDQPLISHPSSLITQSLSLSPSFYNVGTGLDQTIGELANLIKEVVGFKGKIVYDSDKPDGTPVKLLDVTKINTLGWRAGIDLKEGLTSVYEWYLGKV